MAQKIITHTILTDDLTGKELPEGEGATVRFGLGEDWYEIDVANTTAQKIRDSLGQYVEHARKVHVGRNPKTRGGQRRTGSPATVPGEAKEARAWLIKKGLLKADSRGRIPMELWDRYHSRNAPTEAKPEVKAEVKPEPAPAKKAAPAQKDAGQVKVPAKASA